MTTDIGNKRLAAALVWLWAVFLLCPGGAKAQALGGQALSYFPADTRQLAFTDLTQLRASPDYALIRQRLLTYQMRSFEDFLHSLGINPDTDVDSVIMGWQGDASDSSRYFGLAEGRFQSDQVAEYFTKSRQPIAHYAGLDLFPFGNGEMSDTLFFAFLNPSLGAFGRAPDLKAIIDVWSGNASPLNSNSTLANWEGELEGSASQWGIVTGAAAANLAGPWLASSKNVDARAFFEPVRAILYRVNWDSGFTAQLSIICKDSQSAAGLAQLLSLLHSASLPSAAGSTANPLAFLQNMDVTQDGPRIELSGSGTIDSIVQMMHANPPDPAPDNPSR